MKKVEGEIAKQQQSVFLQNNESAHQETLFKLRRDERNDTQRVCCLRSSVTKM